MLKIERQQQKLETAIGRLENGSRSMAVADRDELLELVYTIHDGLSEVVTHAKETNRLGRWFLTQGHARDTKFLLAIFEEILENPREKPDLTGLQSYANKLRTLGYMPEQPLLT